MLGSKSTYFHQSNYVLERERARVFELLYVKGYRVNECDVYLKAFDYFVKFPDAFDGATIVKDLQDMPRLDLDAMLHDYHYIVCNVASNFIIKWKADWLYAKGNERKGKGQYSAFSRFIGLTIVGIGFVPYANYNRGTISPEQKKEFLEDYKSLIK